MVRPRVLIIDGSEDSREVLQTALQRRGVPTETANSRQAGLQSARSLQPEVIVVDVESLPDSTQTCDEFLLMARVQESAILVVSDREGNCASEPGHHITKPYHYAALLLKIESLLVERVKTESCFTDRAGSSRHAA